MRGRLTARTFAAGIVLAACGMASLGTPAMGTGWIGRHPAAFLTLAIGALLGELMPIRIPRRGSDEQITVSTAFSFALLLVGGLGPAIAAQVLASVVQDLTAAKPWWRIRFNAAQYSLSLGGALVVLAVLGDPNQTVGQEPFALDQLPAVLVAAAAFFAVNTSIVGTAVALYQDEPILRYLRQDLAFAAISGGVLLCVAPIVAITVVYSPLLVPLFALPMFAIYRAGSEASRAEHAAHHDALTGLANRVAFRRRAEEIIDRSGAACVLLLDLNRFKEVNDTLGHRYGDLLLERIASELCSQIDGVQYLARLGGDEFAIVTPIADLDDALAFAQRIAGSLHTSFEIDGFSIDAEASVGVAMYPEDGSDIETLLRRADVAMYRAKETQSGISRYDERDDHHSPAKLALVGELRSALEAGRDEIILWYQPLLDLRGGGILGVEALVRWEHPEHGLLNPGSFLDIAERSSLVRPLTVRVLDLALDQLRRWREEGLDVTVSVNVSARVLTDHSFPTIVRDALQRSGVPAGKLRLEVTESVLMVDPQFAQAMLGELVRAGVQIAIDDFGTGYSSLAYLAELPVTEVKIDRSFVSDMADGTRNAVIVPSTIDLGHHLGLRVVAEGVEDGETLERLRELGCDVVQGFHIARPMPGPTATAWMLSPGSSAGDPREVGGSELARRGAPAQLAGAPEAA